MHIQTQNIDANTVHLKEHDKTVLVLQKSLHPSVHAVVPAHFKYTYISSC